MLLILVLFYLFKIKLGALKYGYVVGSFFLKPYVLVNYLFSTIRLFNFNISLLWTNFIVFYFIFYRNSFFEMFFWNFFKKQYLYFNQWRFVKLSPLFNLFFLTLSGLE